MALPLEGTTLSTALSTEDQAGVSIDRIYLDRSYPAEFLEALRGNTASSDNLTIFMTSRFILSKKRKYR
jgi:hypothetical protein